MSAPPAIRTERLDVRRTALVATLGPEGPALARVRELWIVLHGYAMRAAPFLEGFRPIADGTRLIVAPEALSRFYDGALVPGAHKDAPVVASWMTREERDAEIGDYLAYLDAVHALVAGRLSHASALAPSVTVVGFSQGGATAARWVASGRVPVSRLVVWGASLPPELDWAARASPLRRAEFVYVAGASDAFITPKVLERELSRLRDAAFPFRQLSFDGGHRLDDRTLRDLAASVPGGVQPSAGLSAS